MARNEAGTGQDCQYRPELRRFPRSTFVVPPPSGPNQFKNWGWFDMSDGGIASPIHTALRTAPNLRSRNGPDSGEQPRIGCLRVSPQWCRVCITLTRDLPA